MCLNHCVSTELVGLVCPGGPESPFCSLPRGAVPGFGGRWVSGRGLVLVSFAREPKPPSQTHRESGRCGNFRGAARDFEHMSPRDLALRFQLGYIRSPSSAARCEGHGPASYGLPAFYPPFPKPWHPLLVLGISPAEVPAAHSVALVPTCQRSGERPSGSAYIYRASQHRNADRHRNRCVRFN